MEPMNMCNIIKQSLRFAVNFLRKGRRFGTVVAGRCFSPIALSTRNWIKFGQFFPKIVCSLYCKLNVPSEVQYVVY